MQVVEAHGARIPLIGLGTWDLRGRTCARLVEQALRLGYRHVDTAEMYDNEREVGEGAARLRRQARGVRHHQDLAPHFAPRELERSAKDSLVRLRLSEVDLLLLHWPNPQIPLSETLGALARSSETGSPATSASRTSPSSWSRRSSLRASRWSATRSRCTSSSISRR